MTARVGSLGPMLEARDDAAFLVPAPRPIAQIGEHALLLARPLIGGRGERHPPSPPGR